MHLKNKIKSTNTPGFYECRVYVKQKINLTWSCY